MATANFSVPEDVKRAFDETFAGQNKSAILADLMREAVWPAWRAYDVVPRPPASSSRSATRPLR